MITRALRFNFQGCSGSFGLREEATGFTKAPRVLKTSGGYVVDSKAITRLLSSALLPFLLNGCLNGTEQQEKGAQSIKGSLRNLDKGILGAPSIQLPTNKPCEATWVWGL